MTSFFDLYCILAETKGLPDPATPLRQFLQGFLGKTGRQVFDWAVETHAALKAEKGRDAGYDDYHRAALELVRATGDFVMRNHHSHIQGVYQKTANPSWWEKDQNGHDDYQQLVQKGTSPEELRKHPWHQRNRAGHEDHWRAVCNSLTVRLGEDDVTPDRSDEAREFQAAWAKYMAVVGMHPPSQWADRRVRPAPTDFSHDGSV